MFETIQNRTRNKCPKYKENQDYTAQKVLYLERVKLKFLILLNPQIRPEVAVEPAKYNQDMPRKSGYIQPKAGTFSSKLQRLFVHLADR